MIEGLDASNRQGFVNWAAVANAGKQFVTLKASESDWYTDTYFNDNLSSARSEGLVCGAYHFWDYQADPERQAYFFLSRVYGRLQAGEYTCLDVETPQSSLDQLLPILKFLRLVYRELGARPLVYTSNYYAGLFNLTGTSDLHRELYTYGEYVADWTDAEEPSNILFWPFWALWQYSASGSCPGVSGPCLLDRFNGTIDRLKAYGIP